MDIKIAILVALAFLSLVFIAFFAVFRSKGKGKIKGPWGMGIQVEGQNESSTRPGVQLKDSEAGGHVRATDSTGSGVNAERVKAAGDIDLTNSASAPPPKK